MLSLNKPLKFKTIDINDKDLFYNFTKNFEPYSDFNFSSIFAWNDGSSEYGLLNDNLIIKIRDYNSNKFIYSCLGISNIENTFHNLLGMTDEVNMVPKVTVNQILKENSNFVIEEDVGANDYIFSVKDTVNLQGSVYKKKRQMLNRYYKKYPNSQIRKICISDADIYNAILEIENCRKISEDGNIISKLGYNALERILRNSNKLNLFPFGFFIDNKLCGFIINEIVDDRYAIGHFAKTLDEISPELFTVLFYSSLSQLNEIGIEFYNAEQDCNVIGVRQYKLSWNPCGFLKKYTVKKVL